MRSTVRNGVTPDWLEEPDAPGRKKMTIKELDYKKYKGKKYQAEILSDRFLSIEPVGEGFDIRWVMSEEPLRMTLDEDLLSDGL